MPAIAIKDPSKESRVYISRVWAAGALALLLLGMLLLRYFLLQIVEYNTYRAESDRNRVQLQSLPPKRGLVYDRNGMLLAGNRPSYVLSLVPERVEGLDATLGRLAALVGLEQSDVSKFRRRIKRRRPYEPVPLRFRLDEEERARLAVERPRLPGVVVEAQLVRHYPQGELFAHSLGYVGRINESEQATLDETRYRGTNHVGKIGLEKHYENILHGRVGNQNVETNALGRVLRVLERTNPVPGADLTLTLDSATQRAALDALRGRRGAVVAMDPHNGDVLALVSAPGFDANMFINGISEADFSLLRESKDTPLFNRAIQGQYSPGSTIKPLLGLGALELGVVTPGFTIDDPGWFSLPGEERRFRDWTLRLRRGGHGPKVDLRQAIEESCDVYFYRLADELGIERIVEFAAPFGFGAATGLDSTHEQTGILPTPEWKLRARGQVWFPGDTINVGIGQGHMLATPLQLAVMTSTIATRGLRYPPRLLREVNGSAVAVPEAVRVAATDAHWDVIHQAMRDVLHGRKGSARAVGRNAQVKMAGKSGTVQVIGIAQDQDYVEDGDEELEVEERFRDHGLFVAFAPYRNPRIAVAVVVENGGGGSKVAAPVARRVIEAYLQGAGAVAAAAGGER